MQLRKIIQVPKEKTLVRVEKWEQWSLTTQRGEMASGWSHEASSHPTGQELKGRADTYLLVHSIQGREKGWSEAQTHREHGEGWPFSCAMLYSRGRQLGSPGGGQSTGNRKSFVQPLPVLSFLLLRRVHELICWQLQDK